MRTIDELLTECPAFGGMESGHLELIAGCGRNQVFEAGEHLLREGNPAEVFYVLRTGRVALEAYLPARGALMIETIEAGDLLGWSWLFPPYRVAFDATAMDTVRVIAFDGACLRGKTEEDPALGFELMKRIVPVILERLQATRVRLLDVYGDAETA
ncbi:MAG: cyclic nucleotide-binding domain-containing protein [Solirubrobacterales bacterium]|nr:cyclic nucleotide-binding domain-containing protein [Solirubrobacterales bacterium]